MKKQLGIMADGIFRSMVLVFLASAIAPEDVGVGVTILLSVIGTASAWHNG